MDSWNRCALVISNFICSAATNSFRRKFLVQKTHFTIILNKNLKIRLIDSLVVTCEGEVDAVYGVISYDTNQVSERMHFQFRDIEQLHQDMILGFDWLQSVKPYAD